MLLLVAVWFVTSGSSCPETVATTTTTTAEATTTTTAADATTTTAAGATTTTAAGATTTTTAAETTTTTTTTTSTTTTTYATATIGHFGFDFETGIQTEEVGVYDGGVIKWNPDTDNRDSYIDGTTYEGDSVYLWWRGEWSALSSVPHQHHVGEVALNMIIDVPTIWQSGALLWPLLVNHAYVVKCSPEGYAKFLVTNIDSQEVAGGTWEADVQYLYTSGTTFDY